MSQAELVVEIADLVKLLGASERTIRTWCRTGLFPPGFPRPLPAMHRKWCWSRVAVEQWLAAASSGRTPRHFSRVS